MMIVFVRFSCFPVIGLLAIPVMAWACTFFISFLFKFKAQPLLIVAWQQLLHLQRLKAARKTLPQTLRSTDTNASLAVSITMLLWLLFLPCSSVLNDSMLLQATKSGCHYL
jgi:hypothetical protein